MTSEADASGMFLLLCQDLSASACRLCLALSEILCGSFHFFML